jgi:hypothetical protein
MTQPLLIGGVLQLNFDEAADDPAPKVAALLDASHLACTEAGMNEELCQITLI